MKALLSAMVLAAATFVASCGDASPIGPSAPAQTTVSTAADLFPSGGLLACSPLPVASATAKIGRAGGVINVGPHRLTIPAGALNAAVTITATAPSGNVNLVHLEPEGLQFSRPASLRMSYANCGLLYSLPIKRIAYVNNLLDVLYFLPSIDNILRQEVTGRVEHFSDYVISW